MTKEFSGGAEELSFADPPDDWPDDAREAFVEQQRELTELPVGDERDAAVRELMDRNALLSGFSLASALPIRVGDDAVDAQVKKMSNDELHAFIDRMYRENVKSAVRDLLETHTPLKQETIEGLRALPEDAVGALPPKLQVLHMGIHNGVYDELIAEGVVPGSHKDDVETPLQQSAVNPFATDEHGSAVTRMREQYASNPFSGQTVSLNQLLGKESDDEPVN